MATPEVAPSLLYLSGGLAYLAVPFHFPRTHGLPAGDLGTAPPLVQIPAGMHAEPGDEALSGHPESESETSLETSLETEIGSSVATPTVQDGTASSTGWSPLPKPAPRPAPLNDTTHSVGDTMGLLTPRRLFTGPSVPASLIGQVQVDVTFLPERTSTTILLPRESYRGAALEALQDKRPDLAPAARSLYILGRRWEGGSRLDDLMPSLSFNLRATSVLYRWRTNMPSDETILITLVGYADFAPLQLSLNPQTTGEGFRELLENMTGHPSSHYRFTAGHRQWTLEAPLHALPSQAGHVWLTSAQRVRGGLMEAPPPARPEAPDDLDPAARSANEVPVDVAPASLPPPPHPEARPPE